MPSLRSPDEPAIVETLNADGHSPFLFTCEHAGNLIPSSLKNLGLTEAELATDVVWDVGAGDVTRALCGLLGAQGVLSRYSRLVIDCNRGLSDPASIPETSQRGFPVPGNLHLKPQAKQDRAREFFWPYHNVIQEMLHNYLVRYQHPPVVVSVHSFAPEYHGVERPWHIGVLWNHDKRVAKPLIQALAEDASIKVGDNEPYTAQDEIGFGYALHTHAESKHYPHVMLEIRADEIDTTAKAGRWAERIAKALSQVSPLVSM